MGRRSAKKFKKASSRPQPGSDNSSEDPQDEPLDVLSEDSGDEVQVDFDYFDAKPQDYDGIKSLLEANFGDGFPCAELAMKLADGEVACKATIVRVASQGVAPEYDVLGFMACIDLSEPGEFSKRFLGQLKLSLTAQNQRLGLLLNERIMNLPWELSVGLYQAIIQDDGHRQFDAFLIISKSMAMSSEVDAAGAEQGNKGGKRRRRGEKWAQEIVLPANAEDEIIQPYLEAIGELQISGKVTEYMRARKVYRLDSSKLKTAAEAIEKNVVQQRGSCQIKPI